MNNNKKLSLQESTRVRHDLVTIVAVLKTAISMIEKGDEVRSDIVTMIDVPRERLGALTDFLCAGEARHNINSQ